MPFERATPKTVGYGVSDPFSPLFYKWYNISQCENSAHLGVKGFILLSDTEIDNILQFFNANQFNIKFTLEEEKERTINFLDISITRKQDQKLSLNWYRKPTWSGRNLNFFPHHPLR